MSSGNVSPTGWFGKASKKTVFRSASNAFCPSCRHGSSCHEQGSASGLGRCHRAGQSGACPFGGVELIRQDVVLRECGYRVGNTITILISTSCVTYAILCMRHAALTTGDNLRARKTARHPVVTTLEEVCVESRQPKLESSRDAREPRCHAHCRNSRWRHQRQACQLVLGLFTLSNRSPEG